MRRGAVVTFVVLAACADRRATIPFPTDQTSGTELLFLHAGNVTEAYAVDLADPVALETAGLVSSEAAGLAEGLDQVALSPTGGSTPLPAGEGPRYLPLDEQGFYTVRQPGSDPDRPFVMAVNVDLEESNLTRLDADELVLQIEAPSATPLEGPELNGTVELQMEDQERRQSLWRWLLIAALVLFMLETVISNWVSRRSAGTVGVTAG